MFQYGEHQVRTVLVDGEPWFVLADLCRVLEIANPSGVAARLDEDERNTLRLTEGNQRGNPNVTIVSEPGMYQVVLRSDRPEAKQFRWWLTHDVLPTIRKTGRYGSDVDMLAALPHASVLRMAADAVEARDAARAQLAIVAPKARSWDVLANASGTYTVSEAGKLLASGGAATGPRIIFGQLHEAGWIFRRAGVWTGYQDKINAGLLVEVAGSHRHPRTAEEVLDAPQVRVTVDGLHALRELLGAAPEIVGLELEAVAS
ncbi:BRO family protein [Microbacterium sp. CSI-V]|uniref:BRO family protein n=1 Tax=Microbacterium sp. CSI-V TaxID=1933777 RepID=UPI00158BC26F|nr:phage antirepressor KilAC domain-containing protein [Microbacterium sp. CSI-V]